MRLRHIALLCEALAGTAAHAAEQTPPDRTGTERLSGKAADEQRVDNCKVPVALRGSKPRPDYCRHRARSTRTQ
jgi:hypothetical protein